MSLTCDITRTAIDANVPVAGPLEDDPGQLVAGGGCFWCTEAVFAALKGVSNVESGYAGGSADTADYKSVCSGATGHAEVIRITYDPDQISMGELLRIFFTVAHDPTQLNRQGADRGTQYRSVLFYETNAQRGYMADYISQLTKAGIYSSPIVTTLEPLDAFYMAEAYHQDYAANNPGQPYIAYNTAPKLSKLHKAFADKVREGDS